jgi:cellulose synthase/poly-beta-1,6-N-acetylglucosamine synthase-like glycosyltransferase
MGLFLLWFFFGFGILVQGGYLLLVFSRTALHGNNAKKSKNQDPEEGVTIVVTAKNKFQHLKVLIPKLFEQDYPKFDVMIVNDQSTDRTKRLLEDLMIRYPKLRTVTVKYTPKHCNAKKFALTLGIKVAKNDVILLTDADCLPNSDQWIRKMTAPVREEGKTFALGFSGYSQNSSMLNKLVQFELILKALFYLSFGLWKSPFMGTGRNLCYRKSFFLAAKGFRGYWNVEGGEDSLFVNIHATGTNTKVVIDAEAITQSAPKETWKEYLKHERSDLKAQQFFRLGDKNKVSLYGISHSLYWIGGIGLLIYFGIGSQWEDFSVVLGIVSFRSILLILIFRAASKKLQHNFPKMNVLLNDLLYLAYFWVLGSISYQAKSIK